MYRNTQEGPRVLGKFILEKFWEFCRNSLGEVEKCGGFIAVGDVEDCWLWWR